MGAGLSQAEHQILDMVEEGGHVIFSNMYTCWWHNTALESCFESLGDEELSNLTEGATVWVREALGPERGADGPVYGFIRDSVSSIGIDSGVPTITLSSGLTCKVGDEHCWRKLANPDLALREILADERTLNAENPKYDPEDTTHQMKPTDLPVIIH